MHQISPRVAVVDDEDCVRRAVLRLLLSTGMDARGFASGHQFLVDLAEFTPDCVILDLHMPGLNGFELQEMLAREVPAIQVIVITGNDSSETRTRAMLPSTVAYLEKPMSTKSLLEAVGLALQRRGQRNSATDVPRKN